MECDIPSCLVITEDGPSTGGCPQRREGASSSSTMYALHTGTGHASRPGSLRSRTRSPPIGTCPTTRPAAAASPTSSPRTALTPVRPSTSLHQEHRPPRAPRGPNGPLRLARSHEGTLADLHSGDHGATPDPGSRAHRGRHRLPWQLGPVQQHDPRPQLGPRSHAAILPNNTARAENSALTDHGPLLDAAALAEGRARFNDGGQSGIDAYD